MTATESTSSQGRLLSDAKHALEGIEALEKLKLKGFHQDENGDWVQTSIRSQTATGKPYCLESMWAEMQGAAKFCNMLALIVRDISDLVQKIHPGTQIALQNQVDEITPCNVDRNKFYIRVVSVEKPLLP